MEGNAKKNIHHQFNIKFLGMGLQVAEVQHLFQEVSNALSYPMHLEIIDQPNDILRYDISGIPTIYIDNQIFTEGRMPSVDELKEGIQQYYDILASNDMKEDTTPQKILVPIDPSDTAMTALGHAIKMTESNQATIHALHVGALHIATDQPIATQNLNSLREARLEAVRKRIQEKLGDKTNELKVLYELGIPADVITDMSNDYDLIVMGSTGEHGFLDRLLGSISSSVAQRAHCPVMLIPYGLEKIDFCKIMYACKSDNVYKDIVDELLKVAQQDSFDEIHFVEIIKPLKGEYPKLDEDVLREIVKHNLDDIHFHVDQIRNDSVVKALNDYAHEHDIGLIVMSTKHRGPIQNLFHKSQTKQMVLDIERPLLILHDE